MVALSALAHGQVSAKSAYGTSTVNNEDAGCTRAASVDAGRFPVPRPPKGSKKWNPPNMYPLLHWGT